MPIDLSGLNPPQREAVLHGQGPLVVFAGAGSGKTRVIVQRIAGLVAERGIPPWRICAVTFTNKAAGEMRERLDHLVPGASRDLVVGTFHATCARWLRRYSERIGLARDFTIYDDGDQKAMLQRILRDLQVAEKSVPPRMLQSLIDQAKNEMLSLSEVPVLPGPTHDKVRAALAEYEKRMEKANALDFGDLVYRMVRALEADDGLRIEIAGRYLFLLVDEFQDTNHAQLRLVRALASVHRNVCVVGDDDQSIYRWRGADRRNILDFRKHFEGSHVIKLEQNYRSTKRILRAAHSIIERNKDREPKKLWTENDDGAPVDVVRVPDERVEAQLVVEAARALRREGKSLGSLAVFYRTHALSRVVEEALRGARFPYRVVGGVRFYDRAEVKDLLAYLRVLTNPEDDLSVLRILNVPARGIGKTTVEKLLDAAAAKGAGVMSAVEDAAAAKPGGPIAGFVELITKLRQGIDDMELGDVAERVLDETGYKKGLETEDTPESDARLENLAELIGAMRFFDETGGEPPPDLADEGEPVPGFSETVIARREPTTGEGRPLTRFLESVALQAEPDEPERDKKDVVTLMSVHAAKGLEFPQVIVLGMEEGLFPMRGGDALGDDDELEEERRLAYVALTRAREKLTLAWASSRYVYGNLRMGQRSRFLDDLPPSDLRMVGDRAGTSQPQAWREPPVGGRPLGSGPRAQSYGGGSGSYGSSRTSPSKGESWVDREASEVEGLRRGTRVRHRIFGEGKVLRVEGGAMPKATVEFGDGEHTIALRFLEPT